MKEWNFDKYLPAAHMNVMIAKAEKRRRDEGKETAFLHGNTEIRPARFDSFKRRKATTIENMPSPSAGTPFVNLKVTLSFANTGHYQQHLQTLSIILQERKR